MVQRKAFFKSASLYLIGNVATRVVGFLMIPIYTNFLSPSDYGIIELLELTIQISAIALGVQALGSAFLRTYQDQDDPEFQRKVASTAFLFSGAVTAVVSLLGWIFADDIAEIVLGERHYGLMLEVTFLVVFFSFPREVGLLFLRLKDRPRHFVLFSIANLSVNLALNIWYVAILKEGVWGFLTAKIITAGLSAIYMSFLMMRENGLRLDRRILVGMAVFAAPLILHGLSTFALHFADRGFLRAFHSTHEVGLYSLGYKFGFLIVFVVGQPFFAVWNARVYGQARTEGWQDRFANMLRYLLFFAFLAWTGMCVLIDEAIGIMAADAFHPASLIVPIVAGAYVLRIMGDFFQTLLFIKKRSGVAMTVSLCCAAFNIGLNFLLIPRYSYWGAAWATLATWALQMTTLAILARREHKFPIPYGYVARLMALSLACYGVIRLIDPGVGRIVTGLAICVAYPFAAWFTGCFTPAQKQAIREQIHNFRNRKRQDPQAEAG